MSVLVASGDAGNDATVYLLANDEKLGVNPPSGGKTFADFNLKFTVTDGTATIGVVGGADDDTPENPVGSYVEGGHWWYKVDNFRLEYLGDDHLKLDQTATTMKALNETYKEVTLARTIKPNIWNTFVVPFDIPADDLEGCVFNNSIAAIFVKRNIIDSTKYINGTISFTTAGEGSMSYYVDGLSGAGKWTVSVNGSVIGTETAIGGLLTFTAPAGNVTLTYQAA